MNLFYRFSVTPIRGSVVNAAAYVCGQRYRDTRTGLVFDHSARRATDRDEVAYVACLSPTTTPLLPEALWNAVSVKNKHPKAVRGRMIVAAFPSVLTLEQMIECATKYARSLVRRYRVAVQFAIHVPRQQSAADSFDQVVTGGDAATTNDNWHVHILMSYCEIDAMGHPGRKQLSLDPVSARCNGLPNFCEVQRPAWAAQINEALQAVGDENRVDHRSLADQGLPDEPTFPFGPQRWALEQRGISTDIGRHNAAVARRNAAKRRRLAELARLEDVEHALSAASRVLHGRRQRRAVGQFPWNRRTLGNDLHSAVLYVNKRAGVVATRDGGRFVELGRATLLVDLGSRGQILALLWQRYRSTSLGTWTIDGPAALMEKVNAYFEMLCRPARKVSSNGLFDTEIEGSLWLGHRHIDGDAAATESNRRLEAIAQLGSRRAPASDVRYQPLSAPKSQDDDPLRPQG